jgi:stress-induced morphogen
MAAVTEAQLRALLAERLEAEHVDIVDTSGGCGQSFAALIVSPHFRGLSALKRHRAVNAALRDEIARIHAWSAKCKTPDEWAAEAPAPKDSAPAEGETTKAAAAADDDEGNNKSAGAADDGPPLEGTGPDGRVEGTTK